MGPCDLAPGGVYRAARITPGAGGLLHHRFTLTLGPAETWPGAVCSLWHCPAGRPGSVLPTTLPCGARTFLGAPGSPGTTRPPGQLTRRCPSAYGPPGARPSKLEGGQHRQRRRRPPHQRALACLSVNQAAKQAAVLAVT